MSDQGVDESKQIPFMAKALPAVNKEEPVVRSRPLHEFLKSVMPNIDGHMASSVILTDEPPKWCGESEEDEHYEKVQEIKNAITQQQHNRAVLKMEDFERLRGSSDLDEPKTWALHTRPPKADVCE
jgi:hypothetical protein